MNTSAIGQNIFNTTDDDSGSDDHGLLGDIANAWDDIKDKLKDELNHLENELADDLAKALGVSEWYSVHVLDVCRGYYKPNATAPNAGLNVTNCTNATPHSEFSVSFHVSNSMTATDILRPLSTR